jgi:hypothetical protein
MNKASREMIARLEAMPMEEARRAIASKEFGDIDSPNHRTANAWLSAREAELREANEAEVIRVAREAYSLAQEANSRTQRIDRFARYSAMVDRIIAIIALIIAVVAAREDIGRLLSWLMGILKAS